SSIHHILHRTPTLPYTTLFRSHRLAALGQVDLDRRVRAVDRDRFDDEVRAGIRPSDTARRPSARRTAAGITGRAAAGVAHRRRGDRKSTRLNSSHVKISYAVFC